MSGSIIIRLRTRKLTLLLLVFPVWSLSANDPSEQCLMCGRVETQRGSPAGGRGRLEPSIHGRLSISCVGCHADLESVKDFLHSAEALAKLDLCELP